ncbi:MAG: hypothetical protein HQL23_07230 [Candidatus Omnitrophica bacterium]|nr:hypothetical protein [Candidatus Omnitrophota bacterium]
MLIYSFLLTMIGVLGIGLWLVTTIRQTNEINSNHQYSIENYYLILGVSWFIGYLAYESFLSFLALVHLFRPINLLAIIHLLAGFGLFGFWKIWPHFKRHLFLSSQNSFQNMLLLPILGFVFFWNCYPTFVVDDLTSYFYAIQLMLEKGGFFYSQYSDARLSLPMGENLLYAIGFSLQNKSFLFPQLIMGVSKVMFVLTVYGAVEMFTGGVWPLLASAFIASEEHFIFSGVNRFVVLNIPLMFAVFMMFWGLFAAAQFRRKDYLIWSWLAIFFALNCKYVSLLYLFVYFIFFIVLFGNDQFILNRQRRIFFSLPTTLTLGLIGVVTMFQYLWRLLATGSPLFPMPLGIFKPYFYDPFAIEIGRAWHFSLNVGTAIKNVTAFMVWPGILPLKILPIVGIIVAILSFSPKWKINQKFLFGIYCLFLSIILVVVQEIYVVFEMRYYRFGLGLAAFSATVLLSCIFDYFYSYVQGFHRLKNFSCYVLILPVVVFCIKSSFGVLSPYRPDRKAILAFISGKTTESSIIETYYPEGNQVISTINRYHIPKENIGLFLTGSWPQAAYRISGNNFALANADALPSRAYFDKVLLAKIFLKNNIQYIFNRGMLGPGYPLQLGTTFDLVNECGTVLEKKEITIWELNKACLKEQTYSKDPSAGESLYKNAHEYLTTLEKYDPFLPPPYGKFTGVVQ